MTTLQTLIKTGIILSAVTLLASLYALYRPFAMYSAPQAIEELDASVQASVNTSEQPSYTAPLQKEEELQATEAIMEVAQDLSESSPTPEPADILTPDIDNIDSVILDTALGPMLYYNQEDSRWSDYLYGGSDPMHRYGCGPTTIAMLINSFGSENVTPVTMADWAFSNGFYAPESGSYHSLIPKGLSAFGLNVESVTDYSYQHVEQLLNSGNVLVALMGNGSFTENGGHFVIITKINENGSALIADSKNYDNCTKEWDLNLLLSELKPAYDSGPLWSVSID